MGGGEEKKSNPSKKKIFFFSFFLIQLRKNISSLFYIYNLHIAIPTRPSAYNFKHSSRRLAHITFIAANHTAQKQSDDASQNTYKENY